MKKLISLMGAVALVLTMAACAGSADSETSIPSTGATSTLPAATQTTAAPAEAFEPVVLVENGDVTVKITGIDEENLWGYTLKVYLENNTDKELMFTLDNVSVNGFMCDPFWASTVDAGKKANGSISFSKSDFEANGITTVEEITFTLRAYDSNDWLAEDVVNETFTVQP